MRYKLQHSGMKCNVFAWALPLKIGWDQTCKKDKGFIKYGVVIWFLCFWVYVGVWDKEWTPNLT